MGLSIADRVREILHNIGLARHPEIFAADTFLFQHGPPPLAAPPGSRAYTVAREFESEFVAAISNDEDLRQFAEPPTEHGLLVYASTGEGWRVQPNGLAAELVTHAAVRVLMTGQRTDTPAPLLAEIANALDEFRRLVRGESGTAYALTGFESVRPAGDRPVLTPWGELRETREFERAIQPFGPVEATAVLETPVPLTLTVGEQPPMQTITETMRRASEAGGRMSLVLVLATWPLRESARVIGDAIWRTTIVPAYPGAAYTGRLLRPRFHRSPQHLPPALTQEQVREIEKWAHIVNDRYNASIDIAARRTVSAIRERLDREDAIIDAVVAWENLFGHSEATTEVTFRVTTAIARLLETEPAARRDLSRSLKQIYGVRSRVVHGLPTRETDRLDERSELATAVTVRCLRTLFEHRTDLLADRDRAMRLLLED